MYSLFTEILSEMHNCDDILFAEDGAWTSMRSKFSSSKTCNKDQNSLTHRVPGLYSVYFFLACKSTAINIPKRSLEDMPNEDFV